jgi:hypothetical protein
MVRNEQILKDILLKMNYDPSKTLNENIEEQMGEKQWMTPRGMDYKEHIKSLGNVPTPKIVRDFGNWISDPHVFLPLAVIVLTFATGGTAGLVAAGILELADIALYVKERDYTSAGIGAVFVLIPGAQLIRRLGVGEITENQVKTLIKKVSNKLDLTNTEKKILNALDENKNWIKSQILIRTAKGLSQKVVIKSIAKGSYKAFIYTLLRLSQIGLLSWKFGWRVTALGGILLTSLQIGKILGIAIEGIDYRNVELPESYVNLEPEEKSKVKKEIAKEVVEVAQQGNIVAKINDEVGFKIAELPNDEKVQEVNIELEDLDGEVDDIF